MPQQEAKVIIVDDELHSATLKAVRRKLESSNWTTIVIEPKSASRTADDFELAALHAIEAERPSAVLLDVRFGDAIDERFRGLHILRKIVKLFPGLPVLMFTQYVRGADRELAAKGSLKWDASVDFIDKLASPDEVALRLRRLVGRTPQMVQVGSRLRLDARTRTVSVNSGGTWSVVDGIQGMRFEILSALTMAWDSSPGEVVPYTALERYSGGEDARASLRVRVREIKDALGVAMGIHLAADEFIINVRDRGYRLMPIEE